jgi:L-alanine-DL-glutamate epimerase-like enolase superfamily enzyme
MVKTNWKKSIMKISNVQAFLMSYAMPEEIALPFWGGVRTILKRDAMLIKVTADNGLTGYAPGPAFARANNEIATVIKNFLVGKDPLQWKSFKFSGSPEVVKTYYAVEVAVLDLVGKYEECSISELMGGRVRSTIKLYGSGGMYMPPEKYAEEAAAIKDMGFPAYKMRPGMGPDQDLKTVELMRKATGPDMGLMVDAHTWWRMGNKSYTPDTIRGLARSMQKLNPYWLEEPFLPEHHLEYKKLKDEGVVPVATGEHEQEYEGFEDLAKLKAADFFTNGCLLSGRF